MTRGELRRDYRIRYIKTVDSFVEASDEDIESIEEIAGPNGQVNYLVITWDGGAIEYSSAHVTRIVWEKKPLIPDDTH